MRLALYQPDMPQNVGAAIRLCACLGVALDVVEPCGFPLTDRAVRRVALDYGPLAQIRRHAGFAAFRADHAGRLVLLETDVAETIYDFTFAPGDALIVGPESAGAPFEVYQSASAVLRIPMAAGARSLNVIAAAAMALGEALRQTGGHERLAPVPK